ncbi:MAG: APC family permease, partial [Oscillospiraceae bacterium]|jgi:amino acid transporter|nr:APC family permease [Oscillospiraceae bacterium]
MLLVCAINATLIVTGLVNSSGLINMLLAGSCFWLASYILTHLNVLVLRRRYPNAQRSRALLLGGIPQILGMAGSVYMIWNISSDMESRLMIYKVFGIIFVILALFAFTWVKLAMKVKAFEPTYIGKMNIDKSIEVKTSL